MAVRADSASQYLFVVRYEGQNLALRVPTTLKVGDVVKKAAEQLKTTPEGLIVLHLGLEVPDDMTVQVRTPVSLSAGSSARLIYAGSCDPSIVARTLVLIFSASAATCSRSYRGPRQG